MCFSPPLHYFAKTFLFMPCEDYIDCYIEFCSAVENTHTEVSLEEASEPGGRRGVQKFPSAANSAERKVLQDLLGLL